MGEELKVWEEYPPSKYGCTLSNYVICLSADLVCSKKYTHDEIDKKVDEAMDWVHRQPESNLMMI